MMKAIVLVLIICPVLAMASDLCRQPNTQTALDSAKACVDQSSSVEIAKGCSLIYEDYLDELQKWKSCRMQEIQAENNERITKFVTDAETHDRRIRKHMYCLSLGKLGTAGTTCDIGQW
jgi:hypothetical protein